MAEPRRGGGARRLTTRAYAPQPVRSPLLRVGASAALCAACLAAGAVAATWHAQQQPLSTPCASCAPAPAEELLQAELSRSRLALAQEEAARAALQKTADASAAEVDRLQSELRFLRSQRGKRP